MKFIISFTDSHGEHKEDVGQHDQGKTHQKQKKTVTSPFNAEPTGTEQHQSILNGKKTAQQVYICPKEGMYSMPYMRELGGYLGQPSLLKKDFDITGINNSQVWTERPNKFCKSNPPD